MTVAPGLPALEKAATFCGAVIADRPEGPYLPLAESDIRSVRLQAGQSFPEGFGVSADGYDGFRIYDFAAGARVEIVPRLHLRGCTGSDTLTVWSNVPARVSIRRPDDAVGRLLAPDASAVGIERSREGEWLTFTVSRDVLGRASPEPHTSAIGDEPQ